MTEVLAVTQKSIDRTLRLFSQPVMTSAFGLNGMVLVHVLQEMGHDVPVLFVDTGLMFSETLALRERVAAMGVSIVTFMPRAYPLPCDVTRWGFCDSPEEERIASCCEARKVEPMRRGLAMLRPNIILTPRGRFQSVTRRELPFFEGERRPPRFNPLACWSQEQTVSYVKEHDVPHNPLHDEGYHSVGCWPCTRPVKNGEDVRAGRWDGLGKVECGIWE